MRDGRQDELQSTLKDVAALYSQGLSTHGHHAKAVGWRDLETQTLRFEKMTQILSLESFGDSGIEVNDLGCGYGAMFVYLDELLGTRLQTYRGYDISDAMLEASAERYDDKRAVWISSSKLTEIADYSFASGTFNVRFQASDDVWLSYVQQTLLDMGRMSRLGFAFNLLTTYVDWKEDHLFYGDPFHFFDFCKRNISKYVLLLHDYPLYEWTIIVRMGREPR